MPCHRRAEAPGETTLRPRASVPKLLKRKQRIHDQSDLSGKETGVLIETHQCFSVLPLQLGLIVPRINLAGHAVHQQPDHRGGMRGEMGRVGHG